MNDKELAVYRLIRAHYLAQFLPHHEFDRRFAQLACGGQSLLAVGKQIAVAGWRQVLAAPEESDADDGDAQRSQVLPALRARLSCQVGHVEMKALKTLPPKPYTQGELVKAMKGVARLVTDPRLKQKLKDTTGIGTEATRANIISGLLGRGYLLQKGRAIRASDAAFTLIDTVPAAIADPGCVFRPIVTAHSEKGVTGDSEVVTGDSDLIVTDLGRRRNHRSRCRNRRSRSDRNGLCGQRGNHPCHGYPRALCAERRDAGGADCHAQHQGAVTAQVRLRALA